MVENIGKLILPVGQIGIQLKAPNPYNKYFEIMIHKRLPKRGRTRL
jgi:hypothetical protein